MIRRFVIGGAVVGGLVGLGALPGVARAAGGEPTTIIVIPGPAEVTGPAVTPSEKATPPGCETAEPTSADSPELAAAKKRVDQLSQSGWAYKTGTLQRAENKVAAYCGETAPSVY